MKVASRTADPQTAPVNRGIGIGYYQECIDLELDHLFVNIFHSRRLVAFFGVLRKFLKKFDDKHAENREKSVKNTGIASREPGPRTRNRGNAANFRARSVGGGSR
jgi:hypothetical protein